MKWEKGPGMNYREFNQLQVGDVVSDGKAMKIITEVVKMKLLPGETAYLKVKDFFYEHVLPEELR